jgi:ubiquinone/menaquinone biosynthesis C-methylase UbiE
MGPKQLFDEWPERYDRWFESPVGRAVLMYERALILELLAPRAGERILDAGVGTGLFTRAFREQGAGIVGLDISLAMLHRAAADPGIGWVAGDMKDLPFAVGAFDKVVSVAALEFIDDERRVIAEFFRVTRPGGVVVAATLNSLSPWAARRRETARRDLKSIFSRAFFRSPAELLAAAPVPGVVRTAIHFAKDAAPEEMDRIERQGQGGQTGAFVAARWEKP